MKHASEYASWVVNYAERNAVLVEVSFTTLELSHSSERMWNPQTLMVSSRSSLTT